MYILRCTPQAATLTVVSSLVKLGGETARSRLLVGVAAVTVVEVAARSVLTGATATHGEGPGLLLVSLRDNTRGKVKPLAEVLNTLVGEGVVVVLPRELGLDVASRGQRLHGLDDVEVLGVDVLMLRLVEVLLGDKNALCELAKVQRNLCEKETWPQARRSFENDRAETLVRE